MNLMRTALLTFVVGLGSLGAARGADGEPDRRTHLVRAIASAKDAIVNLRTMRSVPARIEDQDSGGRVKGLGTGVLIDPRGFVVTNYHVVANVDEIQALTSDGRQFRARVVGNDDRNDLAVLRLDSKADFKYLPLYGAGDAILGETVIAIGNPYGLENTVTTGIVSNTNRELKLPNGELFNDLIQTDAPINPGNSGGPLINIQGRLLGVNVAIRSHAQGIGFAIPTKKVRKIVSEMMRRQPDNLVTNGLYLEQVETTKAGAVEGNAADVFVKSVEPNSPFAQFGFQEGDRIIRVSGGEIHHEFDFNRHLWARKPGETLTIQIERAGKLQDLVLKVQARDNLDEEIVWKEIGIRATKAAANDVQPVYNKLNGGLAITLVRSGSPAALAGLQVGDILIGLHEWETIDPNNIRYVLQRKELANPVKYNIIRNRQIVEGQIEIPFQK